MEVFHQRRILCADDSKDNCELLQFILSEEGYLVETAGSIAEAVRVAKANKFDLYLIDLSFEDGSGFDLIEEICSFDSSTRIMVCSGNGRESVQEAVREAGVQVFLTKPIDTEMLVQTVAAALRNCSP